MYKELFRIKGTVEDVNAINQRVAELTGDDEPIFDPDTDEWRAWVEWKDGDTIILMDEA